MKVLVVGGAGFIGSHTVEKLLKENCLVHVLDNFSSGCEKFLPSTIKIIKMDIRDSALCGILKEESYDAVINLAAQVSAPFSIVEPYLDTEINLLGMVNLLEACRKSDVKKIVFASTAAVYGDNNDLPLNENADKNPLSFYGLSKLTVEQYLKLYAKLYGLKYNIMRYANVYGERQGSTGEGGVISIFLNNIRLGKNLQVYGNGEQTRDFIYVKDVANANFLAVIKNDVFNDTFNISSKTSISVNTLISNLKELVKEKFKEKNIALNIDWLNLREGDILHSILNNEKAKNVLDWQVKFTLKEGLSKTMKYFLKDF